MRSPASRSPKASLLARPESFLGWPFWLIAWFDLLSGYLASMALGFLAVRGRVYRDLIKQVPLMPLYWLLISAAAYRALWQFMTARFEWEKTEHGLLRDRSPAPDVTHYPAPEFRGTVDARKRTPKPAHDARRRRLLARSSRSVFRRRCNLLLRRAGRTLQDAIEAELLQGHLAGGYQLKNPPLYEWLLWTVQLVLGPGPLSYLVLRYALIAATGILFYLALLRTVPDRRLAAAFSMSLVLFYWFGWESHHNVSHSLALLVAILAFWLVALAYIERQTAARAVVLGLVIGLGIMAKWSFVLVLVSFGIALGLTRPAGASSPIDARS